MNSATHRRPLDRDRAVARLRALTIGTSLAAVAAVGGFGAIAAATYDGDSTEITTAAVTTTDGSTATSNASSKSSATSSGLQTTTTPTSTSGSAHASTGSS